MFYRDELFMRSLECLFPELFRSLGNKHQDDTHVSA